MPVATALSRTICPTLNVGRVKGVSESAEMSSVPVPHGSGGETAELRTERAVTNRIMFTVLPQRFDCPLESGPFGPEIDDEPKIISPERVEERGVGERLVFRRLRNDPHRSPS